VEQALRVLVVDDEPLLVRAIVRLLTRAGIEARGAEDGRCALDVLDTGAFDLVLCDVRMPVMDGPALLVALRSRPHAPPLVFLTGYGDRSDQELLALGALAVYGKPIDGQALLDVVRGAARASPRAG
jgi:two-component system CheB/CheR fusion protein